jgi:hypothetical protein
MSDPGRYRPCRARTKTATNDADATNTTSIALKERTHLFTSP